MTTRVFICRCCQLPHNVIGQKGLCVKCTYHQSSEINQTVKRHQEHEEMLRERLKACRESEAAATADRKEFGEKMHYALRSRDRTIGVLREISNRHELRSDGSCKCKAKKCREAELLGDGGVQMLIRRVDEQEEFMRRQDALLREAESTGNWEEYLKGESSLRAPRRGRDSA